MSLDFSQPSLVNLWIDEDEMILFWNQTPVWEENQGNLSENLYVFPSEDYLENLVNSLLTFAGNGESCEALLLLPPDIHHPVFLLTPYPLKEIGDWWGYGKLAWEFDYSQSSDDYLYGYSLGTFGELTFSGVLESLQDPNLAKQQPLRVLSDYTDFSYPTYSTQSVKNLYDSLLSLQIWQ